MSRTMRCSILTLCLLGCTGCPTLTSVLSGYGFTELRPPSRLMAPGTLVWVKRHKPFQGGIVCTAEASLGQRFEPVRSPTMDSKLTELTQQEFEVSAEFVELVRNDMHYDAIKNMTVTFQNPIVYAATDTDVLRNLVARDPVCTQAVALRRERGYAITMVAQALQADVVYNVQFKESLGLNAHERQKILEHLSAKFGFERSAATDSSISGKNLYWGISDDAYLAKLNAKEHYFLGLTHDRIIPLGGFRLMDDSPDVGASP